MGGEPTESLVKFRSGKVLCPDRKGQGKVTFVIKYFLLNFLFMWYLKCFFYIGVLWTKYGMCQCTWRGKWKDNQSGRSGVYHQDVIIVWWYINLNSGLITKTMSEFRFQCVLGNFCYINHLVGCVFDLYLELEWCFRITHFTMLVKNLNPKSTVWVLFWLYPFFGFRLKALLNPNIDSERLRKDIKLHWLCYKLKFWKK